MQESKSKSFNGNFRFRSKVNIIINIEDLSTLSSCLVTYLLCSCLFVLLFLASVCVLHLSDNPSTLLQAITVLGLQQVLKFVETKTNEMSSRKRMCVIIFSL